MHPNKPRVKNQLVTFQCRRKRLVLSTFEFTLSIRNKNGKGFSERSKETCYKYILRGPPRNHFKLLMVSLATEFLKIGQAGEAGWRWK